MHYYDCRLKALSQLLNYNGIDLSPEMCFGLGEGLEFDFWIENSRKVPMIIISGRKINTEFTVLDNLNISYKTIGDSSKSGMHNEKELKETLKIRPVMLTVDRYYLPYLEERYRNSHFGLHSIVIDKNFDVYDSLANGIQTLDFQDLSLARSSGIEPFPPNYEGIMVDGDFYRLTKEIVLKSIKNNMQNYVYGESGIKLLKKFIKQLEFVNKQMESDSSSIEKFFKLQIKFISKYITEFESSSTFYRKVYAGFLKEISSFGITDIGDVAIYFEELSVKWFELGNLMKKRDEPKHLMKNIIEKLKDIALDESKVTTDLLRYCETKVDI